MVETVFHIGAHKCATTSIQSALAAAAPERDDIRYVPPWDPPHEGDPTPDRTALRGFVEHVKRGAERRALPDVVDALCRLIEANADRRRVIFSDENMLGAMPGIVPRFYPAAGLTRAVLDGVAARFPVSVLLQTREPAALLRSCHQFRVRRGQTLSLSGFLETFELDRLSWSAVGETLFDGAAFEWRVLPIERLGDPAHAAARQSALDIVLPGWDLSALPLGVENPADAPLMRAATFVLERAGMSLQKRRKRRIAASLLAIEAEALGSEPKAANAAIRGALGPHRLPLAGGLANVIRLQFLEERQPKGHLHALLVERFAPDYVAFLKRYAPDGVQSVITSVKSSLPGLTRQSIDLCQEDGCPDQVRA